jgi:hypothetical protein
MKLIKIFTATAAVAAFAAAPAATLASSQAASHRPSGVPANGLSNPGHDEGKPDTTPTPGPQATLPAKAKAYGVFCNKESKKHVAGQQGTPFSQCVTAMAKLATGATGNPAKACAKESKKHVAGQHGTPYSQCVSAAAKLKAHTTSA